MMTYDALDGYVVLFGGVNATANLGDTWKFVGGQWTKLSPSGATPSSRYCGTMVYDAADGYVVLFGGIGALGSLGDTWRFAGGQWTKLSPPGATPPSRYCATMSYNAADRNVLLFGGHNNSVYLGDTWTFAGGQWTQLSPLTSPVPSELGAATYDAADGYVLLLGGYDNLNRFVNETWKFLGGQWTNLSPTIHPSARDGSMIAYDSPDGYVLLFGGSNWVDTWKFGGGQWTKLTPAASPSIRGLAMMVYDATDAFVMLFGGFNPRTSLPLSDTWAYPPALMGIISPPNPSIDAGQSISLSAVPAGGLAPYAYQWFSGPGCSGPVLGSSSAQIVAPTSSTSYSYRVSDSESTAASYCSPGDTVTVNPGLGANPFAPRLPIIDDRQSISLTANPTGGTIPLSYQWYSGASSNCASDLAISGATGPALTTPALTSDTYFCYRIMDSSSAGSQTATSTADLVAVNPIPGANAITPSAPAIDSGQSIGLTANPIGGTPPLTYQWYSGASSNCASDAAIPGATGPSLATPALTSTTHFCYKLTDSSSAGAEAATSAAELVTVNPPLVADGVAPSSPSIDRGQGLVLTANPTGGTGPLAYQWYSGASSNCASDPAIPGATGASFTTPALISDTYFCYKVTDNSSAGAVAATSSTDLVTVKTATGSQGNTLGGAPLVEVVGAVALGAVVAGLLVGWALRSRRRNRGSAAPTGEPSAPAQSSGRGGNGDR